MIEKLIIGVAGQMQNGKDTIADHIIRVIDDPNNWARKAFATEVKRIFCDAFKVDLNFIEKWKTNTEAPLNFNKNIRKSLQFIGDGFREIKSNIWIDLLYKNIEKNAIVSDVRYINELKFIKEYKGLNILVWRKGFENDDKNGSEAQLRPIIDYFIRNNVEEGPITQDKISRIEESAPYGVEFIDYFIKNENNITNLFNKVEKNIIKFIKNYEESNKQ